MSKIAEEWIMETKEDFRKLMEQCPLAIEILTPEGQISQVNAAWLRLWGLDKENTAQVLKNYKMLSDKQVKDLGIERLVKSAFAGQDVAKLEGVTQ